MDNEIAIDETGKMTSQSEKSKLSGLGARLRKARESMHLTQKEAAARLYLNPKIVEVIENEAFFDGPPITFMRGYLRSYARLLNVSESDINTAIDELELNISPTTLTAPALQASPIYRGDRYIRWITYLIVLTLISLVVLWWSSHSKYVITDIPTPNQAPATTTTTTTDVKNVEALPSVVPENTAATVTPTTETTKTAAPTTVTPAAKTESVPAATTPATVAPQPTAATQKTVAPEETTAPASSVAPPAVPAATTTTPTPINPDVPVATTTVPGEENPANATAAVEKPAVTHHKKKHHRRHQYRPIENMEIPEPD